MNWNNKVAKLLKIGFPFIQAPMLNVTTPEMVAIASNLNCLGSLPLGYADKQKAAEQIRSVKKLTKNPFAVNLFSYKQAEEVPTIAPETLKLYYKKYNLPFFETIPKDDPYTYYTELLDIIIEEAIPVISFHFGIPDKNTVNKLKSKGRTLIATATCVSEAKMIEENGIDIVVAQGIEAGGNRGTFVEGFLPEIGLLSLIPQIVDAVHIPVIAAGGLMDPRSVASAFLLGAQGVQLGSLFLRSKESAAPKSWKDAIASSTDRSTVLTRAWSGRYARCLKNNFVSDVPEKEIFPIPIQNYMTHNLRQVGRKEGITEIQSLFAGQSAHYAQEKGATEILEGIIKGTSDILSRPYSFK